jgi:hypothetical protein
MLRKGSNMSHILFTGNFRDLIPMGFRFEKKFARNYRCYTTYNPEDVRNSPPHPLWIYQKGRSVEIDDWDNHEVSILKYMEGKTFEKGYVVLYAVKATDEIRDGTTVENTTSIHMRYLTKQISQEKMNELVDKYYATYREVIVDVPALYKQLDLIKGMYQIVEGD